MEYNRLLDIMTQKFNCVLFQNFLSQVVNDFAHSSKSEMILLLSNERILKISKPKSKNKPTIKVSIGFPFSVCEVTLFSDSQYDISFHYQGNKLRLIQFNFLKQIPFSDIILFDKDKFKQLALSTIASNFDEFIFIEPYRFIGDSFIILQVVDFLAPLIKAKQQKYFSYNSVVSGTFPFENSNPIDYLQNSNSETIFVVQPDFIDDQFENTTKLISTIAGLQNNVILWVVGRNLIIVKEKHSQSIQIFKNDIPDFVLWNENKEDMLQKSVQSFVDFLPLSNDKDDINNGEGLINIYTSTPIKDINSFIVKSVLQLNTAKHSLLLDNKNIENQSLWEKELKSIDFLHSHSLADTYDCIKKCQYIYTSDSAVAHIANRLNKHTVVFYNSERWDNDSFVSVIHHSLIGFASHKTNFFPIILNFGVFSEIEELSKFLFALQSFTTISYSDLVIEKAKKYIFSVQNNEYENVVILRKSFIEQLSKELRNIELVEKYYFAFFTENIFTHLEKDIPLLRNYVEKLSPIYKIAKVLNE